MTAEELYAEIKAALRYFDLPFGQMGQMLVVTKDGTIEFHHDGRTVTFRTTPNV